MKKYMILSLFAFCSTILFAQTTHEVSVQGGIGYSSLMYKLPAKSHGGGFGGEFGIGYTCIIGKHWGINTGFVPSFYNTIAQLEGMTIITHNLVDNEIDPFHLYTTFNDFKEKQNAIFLNFPFMMHFQTNTNNKFYLLAGAKFGLPVKGNYSVDNGIITNRGYYYEADNWAESQEFAGFGKFPRIKSDGKLSLKPTLALTIESGIKWSSKNRCVIYTGIFFDYGLTNIYIKNDLPFVNYKIHSASDFTLNDALTNITNKINIFAIGINLRISFVVKE